MTLYDDRGRKILSYTEFALYSLIPILSLFVMASTPTHILNTKIKQALSFPLLISLVVVPYIYKDPINGTFSMFYQVVPFALFLRFLDIFWITPILYKKECYIPNSVLSDEFWSSVRIKERRDSEKGSKPKALVKDRRFYHLFAPIFLNMVAYDIVAAWAKTFSEEDILEFEKGYTVQYFLFFLAVVIALTTLMNFTGKILQMLYCIVVDRGYYAPGEWRNVMEHPLLGDTLEEVWSRRWHRNMRSAWVASAFKPVHFITSKYSKNKYLATGLASFAVFIVSGLTHEYAILCGSGWEYYRKHFIGDQVIFFCINGVLVVFEKTLGSIYKKMLPQSLIKSFPVRILLHIYVLGLASWTFPYFINGFAHLGLYNLNQISSFIEPAVRQFLSSSPVLRQFCGSLL